MPPKQKKASKPSKTLRTLKDLTPLYTITVETNELAPSSPSPCLADPLIDDLSSDTEKGENPNKEEEEEGESDIKCDDGARITWTLEMLEALIEYIL
jgi:hypothetical protein